MNEMTMGQKIRELRLTLQMTQKELAGDFITRNMLSQIENDQATPSMKTMEYLAKQLGKSMGYFVDDDHKDLTLSKIIAELIALNEGKDYEGSVALIEEQVVHNPIFMRSKMMMDLYMNSYMYLGNQRLENGLYEEAKGYYEKILRYEKELLMISDVYLYKVYAQLSEVNTYMREIEQARLYHKKGKDLIGKLIASREVQSLYMNLVEENYDLIIQMIPTMDVTEYDENSLARYNRVVGSAYYNKQAYKEAIEYLERAIELYKNETYRSITCLIYDELSKCYSEIGDYKKAYDCLNKSQLKNKG